MVVGVVQMLVNALPLVDALHLARELLAPSCGLLFCWLLLVNLQEKATVFCTSSIGMTTTVGFSKQRIGFFVVTVQIRQFGRSPSQLSSQHQHECRCQQEG